MEMPLDRVHIRDLRTACIVGIFPHERTEKQEIIINVTMHADLRAACLSDRIEETVDYKAIKKQILAEVAESSCFLIERLAEMIAGICLEHPLVRRVDVCVDKAGALRFARSAAIEITRRAHGETGRDE